MEGRRFRPKLPGSLAFVPSLHTIVKRATYFLLDSAFFLPRDKKISIERRYRGRAELRKLQLADLVIVSFGKSGRTWLRVMLSRYYQLRYGLDERCLIEFDNLHRQNPGVPRILFTHDNYLKDYTGNRNSKVDYYNSKVILLSRNPLDVAVSQYFQWKHRMPPRKKALNAYPEHGSDVSIYDFVMNERAGLPKIIDYLNAWAAGMDSVKHLLMVSYENMHADTIDALERILKFAGETPERADLEAAVDFASVDNMRRMEKEETFSLSGGRMIAMDKDNSDSYKVRKAIVGGYRDYFDDRQIAAMNELVAKCLDPVFGYGTANKTQKILQGDTG